MGITPKKIREWKVVSTSVLIFTLWLLSRFLEWVYLTNPSEVGTGVAITGIAGSLVGLIKVVLDYALSKTEEDTPT